MPRAPSRGSPPRPVCIFAPHFDDLALMLGGLALKWKRNKIRVEEVCIFSRSNYINGDTRGNGDISATRVAYVSAIRLVEELACLRMLGAAKLTLLNLPDSPLRGHRIKKRGFEFVRAAKREPALQKKIEAAITPYLSRRLELYFPLAIRGHVDHIRVRDAAIAAASRAARSGRLRADIFFCEDQPYAGTATRRDWQSAISFITARRLEPVTYPINLKRKQALLRCYPSQSDPVYFTGVTRRARQLAQESHERSPQERIYMITPRLKK